MSDERLINIEVMISEMQKVIDDLNSVVIEQGKKIEQLQKVDRYIIDNMEKDLVKPLSEETPPPHY